MNLYALLLAALALAVAEPSPPPAKPLSGQVERPAAQTAVPEHVVDAKLAPASAEEPTAATPADTPANEDVAPVAEQLEAPDDAVKADVDERLKSLDAAALDDDQKKQVREIYQQALESFALAVEQVKSVGEYQKLLQKLPEDLLASKARLEMTLQPFEDVTDETLGEVETRAATTEQWLNQYRDSLATCESWLDRRNERLAAIPAQASAVRQQLDKLSDDEGPTSGPNASDLAAIATRTARDLKRQAQSATLRALELEQRYYQEAVQLYQQDRDHWDRKVAQKEKRLAQLREEINRRRENEAQVAQQQARQAAETAAAARPATIVELAQANAKLAEDRAAVAAKITAATEQLAAARAQSAALAADYKRAQEQDELPVLSDSLGQLLRQQQSQLPNLRQLNRRRIQRDAERSAIQLAQFDLRDQRSELADVDAVAGRVGGFSASLRPEERAEIRTLLSAKITYLEDLKKDYETYLETLGELNISEAELAAAADQYANFIAERVLWIRSCAPPQIADLRPAARGLAWSLDVSNWSAAGQALTKSISRRPVQSALYIAGLAALVAVQRPARRRLAERGHEASKRSCAKLEPTLESVGLTMLLAAVWPATVAIVGWSLDNPLGESEFVRALSASLRFTAVCLLVFELVRRICREGGLADAHFEWPAARLLALRRTARGLTMLVLPLVVWIAGLEIQTIEPAMSSTLGRALFVVAMAILSAVGYRTLLAASTPFRRASGGAGGSWLAPLHVVWRPALVALPLALAGLSVAGYYYTAQQAALGLLQTAPLLLAVLTLGGVTRRWLLVNRRRLAREQARQRRALAVLAAENEVSETVVEFADDSVDLYALSEQTRKLIRTILAVVSVAGMFVIWSDLLPALRYLGEATVIPGLSASDGYQPLTWSQLFEFTTILALTYLSVRDIPALLELVVLQHLPLEGGVRYALTTLCRYLLAALGIPLAFRSIGVGWDHIQWLVAAMSVGLGFGLQEIFGNFVSGVILLFERPIRVGDIVTLGETTGVVNRIRMRATTIVDWDRKEYIVPNKDLVTQRLLNWTLTDHMNRIVVKLGVLYGSDTERACQLLREAAAEQPHVLREPAPSAVFDGFGPTALNLTLQCFLPSLENRTATIHNLHTTIDRKFKEAGLEIPFPAREVQVRVMGDLPDAFAAAAAELRGRRGSATARRPDAA